MSYEGSKLPKLSYVKDRLREVVTADYSKFIKEFTSTLKHIIRCRYRVLVVLSGNDYIKLVGIASQLILKYIKYFSKVRKDISKVSIIHTYHDEFEDSENMVRIMGRVLRKFASNYRYTPLVYEVSEKVLGTTHQVLVMDLIHDLKPNDLGRLLGVVEGGGLIILLTPEFNDWINSKTLFRCSLVVPRHPEPRYIFIRWVVRKLYEHNGIYIFDVDHGRLLKTSEFSKCVESVKEVVTPEHTVFPQSLYKLALTQDQVEVIKLIEDNFISIPSKYRRLTLIITADRGRGKSCAVGIGIVGLITELLKFKNRVRVGVTAHDILSVQSLMKLAMRSLDVLGVKYRVISREGNVIEIKGDRFSIEYWQPTDIIKLRLDVLVVDEAAGIPVPLLHKMWLNFRRTIFATTIHGYEGAGRGFSVRFLKRVREDSTTKLIEYEMNKPIRYALNDPIEAFQFDTLLLDAEPDQLDEQDFKYVDGGEYEYLKVDPEYLFSSEGEKTLRSLFGIYVLAHYRNEPDDLGMLADAPHHHIRIVRLKSGKIVAAAQLAEEGGIPDEYIDELLYGGKIAGNIIPDRLLKHLRRREFGKGLGWRVVRIAVHPQLQGRGIGSFLIKEIIEEARERGYDWVGSGFGINKELLNFWLKNGFKVLHLSPDRNPVSGEYTSLVIYPLSSKWVELVNQCLEEFIVKFVESLHDVYRDFEPDVAYLLLRQASIITRNYSLSLTQTQLERLKMYVRGVMTYETVCDAVVMVTKKLIYEGKLNCLDESESVLLISKVLQGLPWQSVAEVLRSSKLKVAEALRGVVAKVIEVLYGLKVV